MSQYQTFTEVQPHRGTKRQAYFYPGGKQKKPRSKPEKPEDYNYFCDSCDRGFKVEDKYKEHVDGHQKCHIEGCPYIAAPKLVTIHVNMQHRSGMAKKIWQLESKEDIEKWRAERRKNFPTSANITKKREVHNEKMQRGQVLENQYFGKMRGRRGRGRNHGGRKQRGRYRQGDNKQGRSNDCIDTDKANIIKKDATKDPLSYVLGNDSGDSDQNEDVVPCTSNKSVACEVQFAGGLGSLAAAYGSDSEDEPHEIATGKPTQFTKVTKRQDDSYITKTQHHSGQNKGHKGHKKQINRKQTILQKLLASDIRHERNVIFQCIRHVVKNDFFGLEKNPKAELIEKSVGNNVSVSEETQETFMKSQVHDDEIWDDVV